jgi:hypothetical protein
MGLLQLSNKWAKIDFEDLAIKTLRQMDDFIADLNRKQLAEKGVNDDGEKLEPEYSPVTNMIKTRSGVGTGRITSHVTLFNKGNLHKSIFADIDNEIILGSFDEKVGELSAKYGDFLGLTEESITILQKEFRPRYVANIIKALQ